MNSDLVEPLLALLQQAKAARDEQRNRLAHEVKNVPST